MRSDDFFEQLKREAIASGLTFVGSFWITAPDDSPYHVPCEWAKETSLIFHKRGTCFMVQISLHEKDFGHEDVHEYWKLKFFTQFLPYEQILKMIPVQDWIKGTYYTDYGEYDTRPYVPGYHDDIKLDGWNGGGTHHSHNQPTTILRQTFEQGDQPIQAALEYLSQVEKFLFRGRFERLHEHEFNNNYCFCPDNRALHRYPTPVDLIVRERLDLSYMKTLVKRWERWR